MIERLRSAGLSIEEQAALVGVGRTTLMGWRNINIDAEPRHVHGERLLRLFRERCKGLDVPMQESKDLYRRW